ncbi:MAG: hypothetical protein HYT88_04245 [Candidatus Omnitrophica bacterium]|nr:hypothetical protein [Candidatus Omnitrophota bacterium]
MLSKLSHWSTLARQFSENGRFSGRKRHFQSGEVGIVGYGSSLTVGGNPQGLYLGVLWPFAFGSPPLLIPWQSISHIRRQRFFGMDTAFFNVETPKIVAVRVPWKFIEAARSWLAPDAITE